MHGTGEEGEKMIRGENMIQTKGCKQVGGEGGCEDDEDYRYKRQRSCKEDRRERQAVKTRGR